MFSEPSAIYSLHGRSGYLWSHALSGGVYRYLWYQVFSGGGYFWYRVPSGGEYPGGEYLGMITQDVSIQEVSTQWGSLPH